MSSHLDLRLREGTKHSHTLAENTAFMKCFLKGVVEQSFFRKLLADLYFVYSALEEELQWYLYHPFVGSIYFPELHRRSNLEKDLAFYYGENWRNEIVRSPATQVYINRIHEVGHIQPELLIAHAYTRYMGDLSGGQALRNIARSAMNLPADQGTAMYEFEQIPTPEAKRAFKEKYRQALNSLPVDEEMIQNIVAEANYAFALNRDLVHELEADVKAVIGDHVFDMITRQDKLGSTERSSKRTEVEMMAIDYSI
ncbi:heme oxygenase (biliverdin-producing) [Nostoc sp. FACHB-152]|uniref:biliverdin-producing heme oxygenase n=1 Tax=unclassified Nostoc TaxID=2593658 RepID=UPI001683D9E1|nr:MULTISPECIES: heme oxygenase (biliverdin-producing) [unclassified Nostoc]MBD2445556.1 heme oxygenase (biliverdin-producing) [Nostoc sp. FACHB-152]MBD2472535.1 heme oxygenase (biliverdin-producing) [Nostoc sp. FACHB-145]